MYSNRIPEELVSAPGRVAAQMSAGFLMIPVASAPSQNQSPLQGLYQQLYAQAVAIAEKPRMPDLFAIMN